MPDFDVIASTTPQLTPRVTRHYGRKTIAELKTALQLLDDTTYTDKVINDMTYDDLVYAVQVTPEPEGEGEGE
jgi:hypothetical protein